jgi:hypothetical protein
MPVARRIDEIVGLLESFALGEVAVPKKRIKAALKLLDLMIDDAPPPPDDDGGDEVPMPVADAEDRAVVILRSPRSQISYVAAHPDPRDRPSRRAAGRDTAREGRPPF